MDWELIIHLVEQLAPVVLKAVAEVEAATGKPTPEAVQEVVAHLTPGAPNSEVLKPS